LIKEKKIDWLAQTTNPSNGKEEQKEKKKQKKF